MRINCRQPSLPPENYQVYQKIVKSALSPYLNTQLLATQSPSPRNMFQFPLNI